MYLTSLSALLIFSCIQVRSLFFKPCSLSDPKLNECALKNANEALRIVIKGIKAFKIPNLAPAKISQITIHRQNLQMKFTDVSTNVLSDSTITKMNINEKAKRWSFTVEADILEVTANYEFKGQILVFAISGQGAANVTKTKPVYIYTMTYKEVEKNGKIYLDLVNSESKVKYQKTYFKLDNLFPDYGGLGDTTSENWTAIKADLDPVIVKTLGRITDNVLRNIFAKVPKNEIYLP